MKLYIKSLKLHLQSELEYKSSFIMSLISQFFVFFSYYFVILSLFECFGNLKGYTRFQVLLCFAIINFGFSFCEIFFKGLDHFDNLIIDGYFDRLLVRPKNLIFQVLIYEMDFGKLSRLFQSIIILIVSLLFLNVEFDIYKLICLIFMLCSSIIIYFNIFLVAASYCFYTIKSLEVRNIFTDGSKYLTQYPINIYKKSVMFIFTYILPFAFINYYPLLYIIDKTDNIWYIFSPLIIFLYLPVSVYIFYKGVKHYNSIGS